MRSRLRTSSPCFTPYPRYVQLMPRFVSGDWERKHFPNSVLRIDTTFPHDRASITEDSFARNHSSCYCCVVSDDNTLYITRLLKTLPYFIAALSFLHALVRNTLPLSPDYRQDHLSAPREGDWGRGNSWGPCQKPVPRSER